METQGYKNNLFIAALPERDAANKLFNIICPYLADKGVTLLSAPDFHVTLIYIRDINDIYLDTVKKIIASITPEKTIFSVQKIRTYHSALAIQVIPKDFFYSLNQKLISLIKTESSGKINIDDSLGFDPHITLCRGIKRNGLKDADIQNIICSLQPLLVGFESLVDKIALMRKSQNKITGIRYEVLYEINLN